MLDLGTLSSDVLIRDLFFSCNDLFHDPVPLDDLNFMIGSFSPPLRTPLYFDLFSFYQFLYPLHRFRIYALHDAITPFLVTFYCETSCFSMFFSPYLFTAILRYHKLFTYHSPLLIFLDPAHHSITIPLFSRPHPIFFCAPHYMFSPNPKLL